MITKVHARTALLNTIHFSLDPKMGAYTEWVPGCETKNASSLLCLHVRIVDGSDPRVISLVSSLRSCTSLVHTSIYACVDGLDSLWSILDVLEHASELKSLHLRIVSNYATAVHGYVLPLGDYIKRLVSLRDLGLYFDPCWQEQAVQSVCGAMSSGCGLQGLSVGPHVSLAGYQKLSDMIGCNTHLRRLHFRCSRAGNIGEIVMRGVSMNHGLLDISFRENVFQSDDSVQSLSDAIRDHPTLKGLYMNCDSMTEVSRFARCEGAAWVGEISVRGARVR